ncbi:2-dehydropantoate 2-reductase N-terminal domain-containing protein [Moorella sulfitireducens]|uniref:2-dehydropantoate 2-reductase N-terminal domain-containing protein n=1 Tax=Neomoorella sulfitireducens TaxID=2972948 RepID=UPI0021AC4EE2|nr:2-dehydropantoate 2-reductase N-terminal domain-containing protein [Moorella sulfitireducens]
MKVAIIGCGYVGLTTGVALAYLGHQVTGVDKDPDKLELLLQKKSPIHEQGLEELLAETGCRLTFTDNTVRAVAEVELIMVAVGTPQKANGEANTYYVEEAAREVAMGFNYKLIKVHRISEHGSALEEGLEVKAWLEFLPPLLREVPQTWANVEKAVRLLGFRSHITFWVELERFTEWVLSYAPKA